MEWHDDGDDNRIVVSYTLYTIRCAGGTVVFAVATAAAAAMAIATDALSFTQSLLLLLLLFAVFLYVSFRFIQRRREYRSINQHRIVCRNRIFLCSSYHVGNGRWVGGCFDELYIM